MAVSNSCETGTLKFDDAMGILLSEEAHRKSSGEAKTSRSALSVDLRGRPMNKEKEKNNKSKSKLGRSNSKLKAPGIGGAVRMGILRTVSRRRMSKAKRRILCMSLRVMIRCFGLLLGWFQ